MDFTLLPTSVVTDLGVGYPFILSPGDYTIEDLNEFNRNMEEAHFATLANKEEYLITIILIIGNISGI